MICFQISIFEPLETTYDMRVAFLIQLWFAFKLVSLNHWKQLALVLTPISLVVICFQISIFEPLETTAADTAPITILLWFAFKLVSLNHWKQHLGHFLSQPSVVICFQISIFEPLETTSIQILHSINLLWFAFKLVSLNHWKQRQAYLIS